MFGSGAWVVGCALGLVTGQAQAEGPGVRAGDLVIHPSASVAGGYDSNIFFESEDDATAPIQTATVLNAGFGLGVSNRNPNHISLKLDLDLLYRHLASIGDENQLQVPEAQRDDVIAARNGIQSVKGDLVVALLPRSTFTLELHESLRYSERPAYETSVSGFEKIDNAVGADLRFRPGENPDSRAFELRLGYRLRTVDFLSSSDVNAAPAEKLAHEMRFLTSWRFLPKTTALLDFQYSIIDYTDTEAGVQDRDSAPFRAVVGLKGLITNRVSLDLRVGYLNTFNKVGESFSSAVAKAEVAYVLEPTLKLAIGGEREGSDTSYSNFVTKHGAYGRIDLTFLTRLSVGGRAGYALYDYSLDGAPPGTAKRDDPVFNAGANAGVAIQDWLKTKLEWSFENNLTDFVFETTSDAGIVISQNPAEYSRHLVMLSVIAEY